MTTENNTLIWQSNELDIQKAEVTKFLSVTGSKHITEKKLKTFAGRMITGFCKSESVESNRFLSISIYESDQSITVSIVVSIGLHNREANHIEKMIEDIYAKSADVREGLDLKIKFCAATPFKEITLKDDYYR